MLLKDYIQHQPDVCTYRDGEDITAEALVGLEVELEAFQGTEAARSLTYWNLTHDGSLREGGVEFVLKQPLTGYDLESSITELYDKVINVCSYDSNQRTSVHVHIDVRDISVEHLRRIVFVYSMFERFIYDLVSPEREHSFYCTPLFNSVLHRKIVARALDNYNFNRCPKYSGINLRTIQKYGSLEFRMHHGMTKQTNLKQWIRLLLKLRTGTLMYEDVPMEDILRMYSENSAEHVLRAVLGEDLYVQTVKDGYNDRLKQSMRSAQDILLLTRGDTLKKQELKWYSEYHGNEGIPGIDPEVLQLLRERREEILNN